MEKTMNFIRNKGLPLALSILVPMLIMALAYWRQGIYLGSEVSIFASDAFSQYSNFHASFNNMLHGEQSIFYTWYGSLGLNYWAFSAYYLNGIFTPLVFLFDNQQMPDALYVITLVKFGAIGGSFWLFANQTFQRNKWLNTALSISYGLMSFATAYSPVIMWLDGLVYLPLVILGIHRVMDKQKPMVLFISYLLLFLSNFYMAFMIGVFSLLYFIARMCTNPSKYRKSIVGYLVTSLLAGGASMITILPTILDLKNNGESLTPLDRLLTEDTGSWDLIVKNMVGVYDTSHYKSAPFIYIGLLPFVFFLFYFVTTKINLREKILYGSLVLILVLSIYIAPLNLFWHGFHAPIMFLFRYSYLLSFMVILLAGYSLDVFEPKEAHRVIKATLVLMVLFLIMIMLTTDKRYNYINNLALISTGFFLLIYLAALVAYQKKWRYQKWLPIILLLSVSLEAGFNTNEMIKGVSVDWGYPASEWYSDPHPHLEKLVNQTKAANDTLYRMDNLDSVSLNDSFNYGYSGISMFSSIRNRHSSAYLNNLGFRSLSSNLNIRYLNNTLLMDSLLGVKYNLSKNSINKFGFKKIGASGEYKLYENNLALPLGIVTDKGLLEKNAVPSQMELFNYLAEQETKLFTFGEIKQTATENLMIEKQGNAISYSEIDPTKENSVTYEVRVPAGKQVYLNLYPADVNYMNGARLEIKIGNVSRKTDFVDTGQYYDLGYYEVETVVPVTFNFPEKSTAKLIKPDAVFLDAKLFKKSIEKIQQKGVAFQTTGRTAKGEVTLDKAGVVFTTIPYDKGWQAYVDGKKVAIPTFKKAFLTVSVPKGHHTIEFKFLPQGFLVGLVLFIGCIGLFVFYMFLLKKRSKEILLAETNLGKKEQKHEES